MIKWNRAGKPTENGIYLVHYKGHHGVKSVSFINGNWNTSVTPHAWARIPNLPDYRTRKDLICDIVDTIATAKTYELIPNGMKVTFDNGRYRTVTYAGNEIVIVLNISDILGFTDAGVTVHNIARHWMCELSATDYRVEITPGQNIIIKLWWDEL